MRTMTTKRRRGTAPACCSLLSCHIKVPTIGRLVVALVLLETALASSPPFHRAANYRRRSSAANQSQLNPRQRVKRWLQDASDVPATEPPTEPLSAPTDPPAPPPQRSPTDPPVLVSTPDPTASTTRPLSTRTPTDPPVPATASPVASTPAPVLATASPVTSTAAPVAPTLAPVPATARPVVAPRPAPIPLTASPTASLAAPTMTTPAPAVQAIPAPTDAPRARGSAAPVPTRVETPVSATLTPTASGTIEPTWQDQSPPVAAPFATSTAIPTFLGTDTPVAVSAPTVSVQQPVATANPAAPLADNATNITTSHFGTILPTSTPSRAEGNDVPGSNATPDAVDVSTSTPANTDSDGDVHEQGNTETTSTTPAPTMTPTPQLRTSYSLGYLTTYDMVNGTVVEIESHCRRHHPLHMFPQKIVVYMNYTLHIVPTADLNLVLQTIEETLGTRLALQYLTCNYRDTSAPYHHISVTTVPKDMVQDEAGNNTCVSALPNANCFYISGGFATQVVTTQTLQDFHQQTEPVLLAQYNDTLFDVMDHAVLDDPRLVRWHLTELDKTVENTTIVFGTDGEDDGSPSPPSSTKDTGKDQLGAIVGSLMVAVAALVLIVCLVYYRRQRKWQELMNMLDQKELELGHEATCTKDSDEAPPSIVRVPSGDADDRHRSGPVDLDDSGLIKDETVVDNEAEEQEDCSVVDIPVTDSYLQVSMLADEDDEMFGVAPFAGMANSSSAVHSADISSITALSTLAGNSSTDDSKDIATDNNDKTATHDSIATLSPDRAVNFGIQPLLMDAQDMIAPSGCPTILEGDSSVEDQHRIPAENSMLMSNAMDSTLNSSDEHHESYIFQGDDDDSYENSARSGIQV